MLELTHTGFSDDIISCTYGMNRQTSSSRYVPASSGCSTAVLHWETSEFVWLHLNPFTRSQQPLLSCGSSRVQPQIHISSLSMQLPCSHLFYCNSFLLITLSCWILAVGNKVVWLNMVGWIIRDPRKIHRVIYMYWHQSNFLVYPRLLL